MPTDDQIRDIRWALEELSAKQEHYLLYQRYYDGDHALMIDERRLRTVFGRLFGRFRLNLCGAVVDALVDRLKVSGFSTEEEQAARDAEDVWKRNRMDRQAREVHQAAGSTGDAFAIVWPDSNQNPVIYPQQSHEVCVAYSGENPGKVVRAAKLWQVELGKEDEASGGERKTGTPRRVYHRLNLYYPDRIEKYRTEARSSTDRPPGAQSFFEHDVEGEAWPLANQYGQVPVFHFNNNGSLGKPGVSELRDAVPIQDWMNYSVYSLLVGQEFQSFPQRYAVGVEVPRDENDQPVNPFKAGPDRMWVVNAEEGSDKAAVVGQLGAADLEKLISVKQEISLSMAQVTGTPSHYFMLAPGLVSGESQKTAEQKLDAKVEDRSSGFGDTWAALMALAVKMLRGAAMDGLELECEWEDTKPRNEFESWQVADIKASLGVSRRQVLREMGYTDEQIDGFEEDEGSLGQAPTFSVTGTPPDLAAQGRLSLDAPGASEEAVVGNPAEGR